MRTEEEMIAYALEAEVAVLPYLPELLADLDELGSDAELIARVVASLNLPAGSTVLDLGCGKGAVVVEMAQEIDFQFNFKFKGIELFEPFLASCNDLARREGVAERCEFIHGNVVTLAGQLPLADVAVFAALGNVLGSVDETVKTIRKFVKPGGYMVISDLFLSADGVNDFPGFESYADIASTRLQLEAHGDSIVHEYFEPFNEVGEMGEIEDGDEPGRVEEPIDADEAQLIQARAEDLAERLRQTAPEDADAVLRFAAGQQAEYDYIEENLEDAIWVLRRT